MIAQSAAGCDLGRRRDRRRSPRKANTKSPARRGAIPICRATTPTCTRTARRSSGPKEFAGRALDDVKGEELARIKRATQERTINDFQGPIHAPDNWWQDALNLKQGQPGVAGRRSAGRQDSRR